MTYADTEISTASYKDMKETVNVRDLPEGCRYDDMMQDFYCFIKGTKQNPFTYEHDYTVQKVINEVVSGVKFFDKNISYTD